MSYFDSITKISDRDEFFKKNENNIYLFKTIGLQDFEEDDIGIQINNLNLEHKFSVNELMVFRTFNSKCLILYLPMEDVVYCIKFKERVLNSFVLFTNIIMLYIKNSFQIIDIKNFKTKCYHIHSFSLELLYSYSEYFLNDERDKEDMNIDEINNIVFKTPTLSNIVNNSISINNEILKCEKIWSTFVIQKENCYCISVIEDNIRTFKYILSFENKTRQILTLYEFINFINESFYYPLKERTFLCNF